MENRIENNIKNCGQVSNLAKSNNYYSLKCQFLMINCTKHTSIAWINNSRLFLINIPNPYCDFVYHVQSYFRTVLLIDQPIQQFLDRKDLLYLFLFYLHI